MSGSLGRPVYWPLAALALWTLVLTLSPSAAWAQQQSADPPSDATTVVVVAPGDSLWSIAQEQLGPQASSGLVARVAVRIYELNEALIGPDPSTIVVGQELEFPPAGRPSAATRGSSLTAESARERGVVRDTAALEAGSERQAPEAATTQPPAPRRPTSGEAPAPSLPAAPKVALVASVGSANPSSPKTLAGTARSAAAAVVAAPGMVAEAGARADERQRFGLAIIALTLLVGALMARTLPMCRRVGWGASTGYGSAAYAGFYGRAETPGEVFDASARADSPFPAANRAESGIAAGADEQANGRGANDRVGARLEAAWAARRRRLRRGLVVKWRPPIRPAARGGTPTAPVGLKVRRSLPPTGAKRRARPPRTRGEIYAVGFRQKRERRGVAR